MENEQFALDLRKILDSNQNRSSLGRENYTLINKITSQLSSIPNLMQYLPQERGSVSRMTTIFILIRDALKNRGCLLNQQNLEELIGLYFPIIDDLSHDLALNEGPLTFCSDSVAYVYRFIFELSLDQPPLFDPAFSLISCPSEAKNILGLKILSSVVDLMKTPMKHVTIMQKNNEIAQIFEKTQLSFYFKAASEKVMSENEKVKSAALDLMIAIFRFLKTKINSSQSKENENEKEKFESDFSIPSEIFQMYNEYNLTENLFIIFNETNLSKAVDCITYVACISKNSWISNGVSPLSFINVVDVHLSKFFEKSEITESMAYSITNLIRKLGTLIFISQDDKTEFSPTFINSIYQFSLFLFQSFSTFQNSCNNILRFWQILFKNKSFIQKCIDSSPSLFSSIFQEYINGLLNSISTDLESIENFEILINDITPILEICQLNLNEAAEFLGQITHSYLNDIEEGNVIIFYRLCILVLILSSFLNGPVDNIIRENKETIPDKISFFSTIIQFVFETIDKTNQIQETLVQSYESNSVYLENSLIQFASLFLKKFFTSPLQFSDEILQFIRIEKQQAFDLIINRLLNDLNIFVSLQDMVIEILTFFNGLLVKNQSKSKLSSFFSNNEIFNQLITHQQFLGIEAIEDADKASKVAIELCRFYSYSIQYDMLGEFLTFFDQKFSDQSLRKFEDSKAALILYRQIEGILKGSKNYNQYTFVWRWFLQKHSEHTAQCITAQSSELTIIRSICHILINMSIGANLCLPTSSSEGIRMVKLTLQYVNLINENVTSKDDQITLYMVKILSLSITTKNANFGIMKLYGDETIDQMVMMILEILKNWKFENFCKCKNILSIISNAFNSILQFLPESIENDDNFPVVLNFYFRALNEIKTDQNEYVVKNADVYSNFTYMVKYFVKNETFQIWPSFQPHLVILLNTLFDTYSKVVNSIYDSIFLLAKYDQEYLNHVLQLICESFEDGFREEIEQLLQSFMKIITDNNRPSKKVFAQFEMFANSIKKYSIQLDTIQELAPIFAVES